MKRVIFSALVLSLALPSGAEVTGTLRGDQPGPVINRHIYGHFAEHLGGCIYDGIWVGEDSEIPNTRGIRNDVVAALKELEIPNLRWPGGCYADDYHWRDGIGPRDQRKTRVNRHWGKVLESNQFGTHEFLDLCEMIGCEAYIAGNLGSGTPQEMQQWLEYLTHPGGTAMADLRKENGREQPWRVAFFGVGNENWGCGGPMSAAHYAEQYRIFRNYLTSYDPKGTKFVACGPGGNDPNWMKVVSGQVRHQMDAISAHYYVMTGNWGDKGDALKFSENDWFILMHKTLEAEDILSTYDAILNEIDRDKRIGLYVDEWGTWWNPAPGTNPGFLVQQNTLRDALSAALFFHQFHDFADRVHMANIAQTVNVLQTMIITDGPRMFRTPTYHVFDLYKAHKDATVLPLEINAPEIGPDHARVPAVHGTASKSNDGSVAVSLANLDPKHDTPLAIRLQGLAAGDVTGRILTADAMNTHNTFDRPDAVAPKPFRGAVVNDGKLTLTLPAKSVVTLRFPATAATTATAPAINLPNPLVKQRADPWIHLHEDGYYYFTATVPEYDRLELRRSKTLAGLATATPKVIWRKHERGEMGAHIWAPELHHIDGRWYIYFAAGGAKDVWAIRMYALENTSPDPLEGEWVEKGQIKTDWESFSLDATSFAHKGRRYLVWAQHDPKLGGNTCLYIQEMESPTSLKGRQVRITRPELDWEKIRYQVNEGAAVIKRGNRVFLTYSAAGTGPEYCIGLLTADADANLLDPGAWTKSPQPVFRTSAANGIFGPGHNSFTTSKDGKTDLLVYHARSYRDIKGDPLRDPNRHTRVQAFSWNPDGTPHFGQPRKEQ